MNKINYKQKALEYSIGVLLGFFILYFLFDGVLKKIGNDFYNLNRTINKNQILIQHNTIEINKSIKKIDSLHLLQDSTMKKLHHINDGIQSINKKIKLLETIKK